MRVNNRIGVEIINGSHVGLRNATYWAHVYLWDIYCHQVTLHSREAWGKVEIQKD